MAWFSLTEKLAVTGAFLAVVALVVGTEDDPGLVVTGQETVQELRPVAPAQTEPHNEVTLPQPSLVEAPLPDSPTTGTPEPQPGADEDDKQLNPEPGRVPRVSSQGRPPT